MEVLIIITIILWAYSSYLYRNSKFKDAYTPPTFEGSIEEQELIDLIHELYGEPDELIEPQHRPIFSPRQDRTADFTTGPFMSAEAKHNYLLSPEWQELRTQVFTRDNYTCQSCGSQELLNCHHITYEFLGNENLSDLTTLCTNCHTELHKQLGYDRTTIYNIIKDQHDKTIYFRNT